jgi:hypothetical protein
MLQQNTYKSLPSEIGYYVQRNYPSSSYTHEQDPNRKMAMNDEYNTLIDNKTWVLVPRQLMLMLFEVCGFSGIKRNLMDLSRGTKLAL